MVLHWKHHHEPSTILLGIILSLGVKSGYQVF